MRESVHRNAGTEAKAPLASEAARVPVSNRGLQTTIQRSLRVGRAGDRFEQEADAVADRMMRMPAQEVTGAPKELVQRCPGGCPGEEELRRQPEEEEEEEELVQASGASPARVVDPATGGAIVAARGGGAPLPASEQQFFEPRFKRSFAGVRVHAGDQANGLAQRVSARAFTVGRDVFFGAGEWRPGTSSGRRLLAHELTHVVQQNGFAPRVQRKPGDELLLSALFRGDVRLQHVRNKRRTLRKGSSGDAVKKVQEALIVEGYDLSKFGADAKFGSETRAAVRAFQSRWRMTVDGIVGDQTIGLLDDHLFGKSLLQIGEALGRFGGAVKRIGGGFLDKGEEDRRKTACPAPDKAERLTACIQPVVIANDDGTSPTAVPSLDLAKRIWEKCCVSYSVLGTKVVKKTSFRTLDESVDNTPTAEQRALFAAAGSSSCIQLFVPVNFQQGGNINKTISGGGATYDGGKANAKIVVVEGTVSAVVAHELGHATGFGRHDANDTVMKPSGAHNVANPSAVSVDVCTDARTGAALSKTSGKDDCCMSQN